ncbi:hypothetical protein BJ741DRAFT_702220 [Chytriomyces cf. hyalinus JEL632]|nr:hypothetical protein BJ741DRAFT_702220 [Chytriomyces cf. hyalinus JEL632]
MPVPKSKRMMARRQLIDLNLGSLLADPNAGKGKKAPLPASEPVPKSAPAAASKQQKKQKEDKSAGIVQDPTPVVQNAASGQSQSDSTPQQPQQQQQIQAQTGSLSQNQPPLPNQDSQPQGQVQQQPQGQEKSESVQVSSDQGSTTGASVQKGDMTAATQGTTGNKISPVEGVDPKSIVRASASGNKVLQEIQATPYPSLAGSNSSGQDLIPPTTDYGPPIGLIVGISIAAILLIAGLVYVCYRRMLNKRGAGLNSSKTGWVPPLPYKETEAKEPTVGAETRLNTLTNLKRLPNLYRLAIRNSSISSKLSPPPKDAPQEKFAVHAPPTVRASRLSNHSADLELGLEPDIDVKPLSQTSNVSYRVSVLYADDDFEVDANKMEFVDHP